MTGFNQFNPRRDADMVQGEKIYEMDFAINQGDNGTGVWTEQEIRVNPALPYRHLYINFYNAGNIQADVTGILRCFYSRKQVYSQYLRFFTNAAPTTVTQAGGILLPARLASSACVYNGLLTSARGTANVFTLAPMTLMITCDQIVFTPVDQSIGASGNQAWLLACRSAAGSLG